MISFLKKTISGLTKTRNKLSHLFARFSGKTILTEDDIEGLDRIKLILEHCESLQSSE